MPKETSPLPKGPPIPRDPSRFTRLHPDPPAVIPPGTPFPSPEELAASGLKRLIDLMRNRQPGN